MAGDDRRARFCCCRLTPGMRGLSSSSRPPRSLPVARLRLALRRKGVYNAIRPGVEYQVCDAKDGEDNHATTATWPAYDQSDCGVRTRRFRPSSVLPGDDPRGLDSS